MIIQILGEDSPTLGEVVIQVNYDDLSQEDQVLVEDELALELVIVETT